MTDHFFPEEHLGRYYFRPAEHINTGFVLGRPSARVVAFLRAFIEAHYEPEHAGVIRDGMDQRVFNKFYLAAMRCGARGFYEEKEWFAEAPAGSVHTMRATIDPANVAEVRSTFRFMNDR